MEGILQVSGSGLRELHRAHPAAATVLSDFGAQRHQDRAARRRRPLPQSAQPARLSHWRAQFRLLLEARNKKSLALDLSKPEAQAVLYKLVEEADVFITNMPPPVRTKLGITYDHLAHLNDPPTRRLNLATWARRARRKPTSPASTATPIGCSGLMDLVGADIDTTPARRSPGMGDHPCATALTARSSRAGISARRPARARMSPPI